MNWSISHVWNAIWTLVFAKRNHYHYRHHLDHHTTSAIILKMSRKRNIKIQEEMRMKREVVSFFCVPIMFAGTISLFCRFAPVMLMLSVPIASGEYSDFRLILPSFFFAYLRGKVKSDGSSLVLLLLLFLDEVMCEIGNGDVMTMMLYIFSFLFHLAHILPIIAAYSFHPF